MSHVSDAMRRCIDECHSCADVCLETVSHCLDKGGTHAAAGRIRTLLDCAEACQTSANFMVRGSAIHPRVCGVCAEACDRCAAECDQFDDDMMKRCAAACRRCAESCHRMAGTATHA